MRVQVRDQAAAQAAFEAAQAKVAAFGDMEAIEAEAAEVRGFIESLNAPVECDEPAAEIEEVVDEVCAECTIPETTTVEVPETPAAPAVGAYFDETM